MASDPEPALVDGLLAHVCAEQGVKAILTPPQGVEITQRSKNGETCTFLLNHNEEPTEVQLGTITGRDLLSGQEVSGTAAILGRGVRIIRTQPLR